MNYLINEEFDSYVRGIYAWTFDHPNISLWFQAIPLVLWIFIGLIFILLKSYEWRNDSWLMAFGKISVYVFTPILYFIVTGYIGYFYYK